MSTKIGLGCRGLGINGTENQLKRRHHFASRIQRWIQREPTRIARRSPRFGMDSQ